MTTPDLDVVARHCGESAEVWEQVQQLVRDHPPSAAVLEAVVRHVVASMSDTNDTKRRKTVNNNNNNNNKNSINNQINNNIVNNNINNSLSFVPSVAVEQAHWLQPRKKNVVLFIATRPRLAIAIVTMPASSSSASSSSSFVHAESLVRLPHGAVVEAVIGHDDPLLRLINVPLPRSLLPAALLKHTTATSTTSTTTTATSSSSASSSASAASLSSALVIVSSAAEPLAFVLGPSSVIYAASAKDNSKLVRVAPPDAAVLLPSIFPLAWPVTADTLSVPCYLKAKDGLLVLYQQGIFFGMKKPILSFPKHLIHAMEVVGTTSRTFDIRLSVSENATSSNKDTPTTILFSMIDMAHYESVVAYLTAMRFGDPSAPVPSTATKKQSQPSHEENVEDDNDNDEVDEEEDDEDYEYRDHSGSSCDEEYDSNYASSNEDDSSASHSDDNDRDDEEEEEQDDEEEE